VNIVTKTLFQQFPTLAAFADADLTELEEAVKPCGFYKTKAKSIKEAAQLLLERHGGEVPQTMEELLALPGIGRKTANLLLGDLYGQPAVVTDTHFIRITGRLGLTKNTEPQKVETDLRKLLPPEESSDFCHRIVLFGREFCKARKPVCKECPLHGICPSAE
jgi:endonuclease-3